MTNTTTLKKSLEKAISLRNCKFCRLVHASADGLPGLIIDQYDTTIVIQTNTTTAEAALPTVLEILEKILAPTIIVLRNDSTSRGLSKLQRYTKVIKGTACGKAAVHENSCTFFIDVLSGQKTGWFYDQKSNRAFIAQVARAQSVLDAYSYSGGFTLPAIVGGAINALAIDRSGKALTFSELSASKNNVRNFCRFSRGEVFLELSQRLEVGEYYGLVICDPPAFSKNLKNLHIERRGYRKLTQLASGLTESTGFLFVTSCSHALTLEDFLKEINCGLLRSKRSARIIYVSGATLDHPSNPEKLESAYLKAILLQIT